MGAIEHGSLEDKDLDLPVTPKAVENTMTDSQKLESLAKWFDRFDEGHYYKVNHKFNEVQNDLRRIAKSLEKAEATESQEELFAVLRRLYNDIEYCRPEERAIKIKDLENQFILTRKGEAKQ